MALADLSTHPHVEESHEVILGHEETGPTQLSMKDTIEVGRTCANTIEDAAVALGLYAGARVKDGQGELQIRLMEQPPVRGLRVT